MRRFVSWGAFLFLLSPAALADDAQLRRMTLSEVVAQALANNPDMHISAEDEHVAKSERWEVGGRAAPLIHLDGNLQQWNSPFNIPFQLDPSQPPANFPVRDSFTWATTLSAIQPLTGLLAIFDQYHVADLGVDVARIKKDATRRDTGYHAIESYYRLLQAERLTQVAAQSVDELTLQLKQANSFHDNGVVSRDQVLRAELALAGAKLRVIQQRAQVSLARSRLAVAMGMPPSSAIDAIPLDHEPEIRSETTLERAEQAALANRTEMREVDAHIAQSKGNVRLAWYRLLPQVNLVGSWQHTEGSVFQLKDAEFIGGTISWDIWDWGSSIAHIDAANARLRQTNATREKIEDTVKLEVQEAFLNVGTASDAIEVAKTSVASAEENYRLVTKRYDANSATQFDVVDAEQLLTQARAQLQTSTYDYLIARAALKRATGESPEQQQR